MVNNRIGIVIPAFNEERTISSVVHSVKKFGEVIVVNDCSTDKTKQLAQQAGAIVITHNVNRGYDSALVSGFELADKMGLDVLITFDADGQHNFKLLEEYIAYMNQGYDAVAGIRNKFQRISEALFSHVGQWRWGISDALCGMKAYRLQIYRELGYFDSYKSIGTELIIFAASSGKKIKQFPIKVEIRLDKPRFGRGFDANIRILKALFVGLKKY
ncbi:glycosyltransferase family 2 protein [Alphaproteobacteria bacterium]|nr:glycosyltransferase family 2 protein [Alphaproteobacteria bacterium]